MDSSFDMKQLKYIVVLLPLLLQGCDFFYSTVEYKGKEAEPRLCVISHLEANSTNTRIDVLHSEFFLHAGADSLPVLNDALVTLQVNNAPPVPAVFVPGHDTMFVNTMYGGKNVAYGHYEAPVFIQEFDTVRLHVEHPVYGTADALQVCPEMPYMELILDSLDTRYSQMYCHLLLPPYKGDPTDIMAVSGNMVIYSKDPTFAKYDNYQTPLGYYAGTELRMTVSSEPRSIPLILASLYIEEYDHETQTLTLQFDMHSTSCTQDDYRYRSTLRRATGQNLWRRAFPEPPSERTEVEEDVGMGVDMAEMMDIIAEEFSVLGNVEGYQVYGNLTGTNAHDLQPFGCFTLTNWYAFSQTYVWKR